MNATVDNTKKLAAILDIDSLLDMELDKVETLPDYITPPPGEYQIGVKEAKIETYESTALPGVKQQRIRVTQFVETTYAVEDGEKPVANGSLFSETYQGTEEGIKFFKKAAMGIMGETDFGDAKLRDILPELAGMSYKARLTIKTSKPDAAGKTYDNLVIRAIPPEVA